MEAAENHVRVVWKHFGLGAGLGLLSRRPATNILHSGRHLSILNILQSLLEVERYHCAYMHHWLDGLRGWTCRDGYHILTGLSGASRSPATGLWPYAMGVSRASLKRRRFQSLVCRILNDSKSLLAQARCGG